jgi:hypothetical protein
MYELNFLDMSTMHPDAYLLVARPQSLVLLSERTLDLLCIRTHMSGPKSCRTCNGSYDTGIFIPGRVMRYKWGTSDSRGLMLAIVSCCGY